MLSNPPPLEEGHRGVPIKVVKTFDSRYNNPEQVPAREAATSDKGRFCKLAYVVDVVKEATPPRQRGLSRTELHEIPCGRP